MSAVKRPSFYDSRKPYRKLYSSARWRGENGVRDATLRRDILCVECGRAPSTIADHIRDHRGDPVLFFDPKNVRGLCKPCHDKKTGAQHGKGDRTPEKPVLVDGKVQEHGTQIKTPEPTFDSSIDYYAL